MFTTLEEFLHFQEQLRARSPRAVARFLAVFGPRLRRLIHRQFAPHAALLQRLHDEDDIFQEVCRKFFARGFRSRYFPNANAMRGYLARLARSSIRTLEFYYLGTAQRDLTRRQPLDVLLAAGGEPTSPAASPERVVAAREEWDEFVRQQPASHHPVLVLLAEGRTVAEVSRELGTHETSVWRIRGRAERFLRRHDKE
jgi:hypothetical protein